MATKKKLLQAAAGAAGGEALNVEDVFSTYLYEGNGSTQTITNDIDLDGEGGLVWIKDRDRVIANRLIDTERGATKNLISSSTGAEFTQSTVTSFNSNGFSLGNESATNASTYNFASWTFRKAPKFFDVVTYTGTGSAQNISHNLGSVPGMIIVKVTSTSNKWAVFHRGLDASNPSHKFLFLNETAAIGDGDVYWNDTEPTSTQFTVGTAARTNASGETYVAYLFAHNDGDGDFGPTGDADIIKCGSFTGDFNGEADIDLGFEPQWIMIKSSSADDNDGWQIYDTMRGIVVGGDEATLAANTSSAEASGNAINQLNATGWSAQEGSGNTTYIYIAIRRGPMAVPTDATDVFAIDTRTGGEPSYIAPFEPDMAFKRNRSLSVSFNLASRLTGTGILDTASTGAESTDGGFLWDYMNGWANDGGASSDVFSWMWKRAPNYFDVVAVTGVSGVMTINHNLGVAPEFLIGKRRDGTSHWYADQVNNYLRLNTTDANLGSPVFSNFTATTFQADSGTFSAGEDWIIYLFASLDGISRVNSYTGNGSTQTIDCGFSSGARFVLIKRTDSTGDWYVWDTERGIVAGNDPYLELNSSDAEVTSTDWVDPDSSGFIVNGTTINASSAEYIFYAVA